MIDSLFCRFVHVTCWLVSMPHMLPDCGLRFPVYLDDRLASRCCVL